MEGAGELRVRRFGGGAVEGGRDDALEVCGERIRECDCLLNKEMQGLGTSRNELESMSACFFLFFLFSTLIRSAFHSPSQHPHNQIVHSETLHPTQTH